jgi:hypothetical protein
MYFVFVNYTTLGYGDITPTAEWRLLGPMTAMNGVLLFGWSTAVMFDVLQRRWRILDRATSSKATTPPATLADPQLAPLLEFNPRAA